MRGRKDLNNFAMHANPRGLRRMYEEQSSKTFASMGAEYCGGMSVRKRNLTVEQFYRRIDAAVELYARKRGIPASDVNDWFAKLELDPTFAQRLNVYLQPVYQILIKDGFTEPDLTR